MSSPTVDDLSNVAPRIVPSGIAAASGGDSSQQTASRDLPSLSLPKAGGAIRGMGEKFSTNPVTGTASFSVPLALTPGRGVTPQLTLTYDSGAGNGLFGLGWNVEIPSISRSTDKGLPRYVDATDDDVFQFTGVDDLVPVQPKGTRPEGDFDVRAYRPRTEGLFARIERWRHATSGDIHWRVTTKDNITSIYGRDLSARITDPADPRRVFRWLLTETADDRGNIVRYEYKAEDATGVDAAATHERNRFQDNPGLANRYLKCIRYGNAVPGVARDFCFEVVFDYGDHDGATPTPEEVQPWGVRSDPFSSYRAGFEMRTYRLCRRVLMFHRFAQLAPEPVLVSSTDLEYQHDPALTYLHSVTHRGYIRSGTAYSSQSLPPVTFAYTERTISAEVRPISAGRGESPVRLDGEYQWSDLDGEGISGILKDHDGVWFYRRNLGGGVVGPPQPVSSLPAGAALSAGTQLMDLASEGRPALVNFAGTARGFHRRTEDSDWTDFSEFETLPNLDWADPNLKFVDLTGDGLADLLLTADDGLIWYPAVGLAGYVDGQRMATALTEEKGPKLVFADAAQNVYLADMTGDGLTDLVRIRNGEVSYWPNLGYGRFGRKVSMSAAPVFDHPDQFDQRRILLGDVDGSATTDLIYCGPDGVRVWFNQAGNSWSPAERVGDIVVCDTSGADVADLLGKGTACLVLSDSRPDGEASARFIDLMAAGKPHLLRLVNNNMGLHTAMRYESSATYYLADRAAGRPWVTRPAFPVQVVAEVELRDSVADAKLVTTYSYRHGYYDTHEREFRGFGYVEQRDSPSYSEYSGGGLFNDRPPSLDDRLFQPPTVTKRWQHTGWYPGYGAVSTQFAKDYWQEGSGLLLPDTTLPSGLTTDEERELCRALRGKVLREEVYADDASDLTDSPYLITESSYHLRLVQPRGTARYCVAFVHPAQVLSIHSERHEADPRISRALTLEVDEWGNIRKSAQIAYGRDTGGSPEQSRPWVTTTERDVANDVDSYERWRLGIPIETREYEIGGIELGAAATFDAAIFGRELSVARRHEIHYQDELSGDAQQCRLLARAQTTYYTDDLNEELPLGDIGSRALPWRSYQQAFAPGHINALFGERATSAVIAEAGYLQRDGDRWWAPSGRKVLDPDHFYLPIEHLDPFGARTTTTYDAHFLLPVEIKDPVDNVVSAQINYRVVEPWLLTDPNDNRTGVRYDALGMVISTAVLGKENRPEGDALDLSTAEKSDADDPTTTLTYDLNSYRLSGEPVHFRTKAREQHGSVNRRWQESVSYVDGTGQVQLAKSQSEPGLAPVRGPDGRLRRNPDGTLVFEHTDTRWVGTGWTVRDNKGNPIKQYEPYFAPDDRFDTEADLVRYGVTPILRYDPLGRLVETEHPDGTISRVVFNAWEQQDWDRNDTVLASRWYAEREGEPGAVGRAAQLTRAHDGTFSSSRYDALGRAYAFVANNGGAHRFTTTTERDVQGHERAVTDPRQVTVLQQQFDMLGHPAYAVSVDSGERWTLMDITGRPARAWDSRSSFRWRYDPLRRATHAFAADGGAERLRLRHFYGEELGPVASVHNLRTQPYLTFDSAGLARTSEVDFKGNVTRTERRLARDHRQEPDWLILTGELKPDAAVAAARRLLEDEAFVSATEYDALNRATIQTSPDGTLTRPRYNEANLIDSLDVWLRGAPDWTPFVVGIDYNARGQRTKLTLGCGTQTDYSYEHDTFRLRTLQTRGANNRLLQDLAFTYDPIGNVLQIDDSAQQAIFFANTVVEPNRLYTYDPTYRLINAEGREHIGQTSSEQPGPADPMRYAIPHVNDENAMRRYREDYSYDDAGNITAMKHSVNSAATWHRRYNVADNSNRLLATSIPGDLGSQFSDQYGYDELGNMVSLPHLKKLHWDVDQRLARVDRDGAGSVYYQYDATGQRVRSVAENGGTSETRIYCGQWEIYRRVGVNRLITERETVHVTDGTRRIALIETTTVDDTRSPAGGPTTVARYQLGDHLNSVSLEVNGDGALLSYEEYHPFGTTSFRSAAGVAEASVKRHRFTGKEKDAETGFYYHGARYYAPWLGRWISPDPAGLIDGPNRYAYVGNRPVSSRDPSGRQEVKPDEQTEPWDGKWGPVTLSQMKLGVLDTAKGIGEFWFKEGAARELIQGEFAKGGDTIGGVRNVISIFNPLYTIPKAATDAIQAAREGQPRTFARNASAVVFGAVASGILRAGPRPSPAPALATAEGITIPRAVTASPAAAAPPVWLQGGASAGTAAGAAKPPDGHPSEPVTNDAPGPGEVAKLEGISDQPLQWAADRAVLEGEKAGFSVKLEAGTAAEKAAAKVALDVYAQTRDWGKAGKAFHDAIGAHARGADRLVFGAVDEVKTANPFKVIMAEDMVKAMNQAEGYAKTAGITAPSSVTYFEVGSGNKYVITRK